MERKTDFILIGAAILDVLAQPVSADVFTSGSLAAGKVTMNTGGDAMNEASVLAGLGASVRLVSKIGQDAAGTQVIKACQSSHIDTAFTIEESSIIKAVSM